MNEFVSIWSWKFNINLGAGAAMLSHSEKLKSRRSRLIGNKRTEKVEDSEGLAAPGSNTPPGVPEFHWLGLSNTPITFNSLFFLNLDQACFKRSSIYFH